MWHGTSLASMCWLVWFEWVEKSGNTTKDKFGNKDDPAFFNLEQGVVYTPVTQYFTIIQQNRKIQSKWLRQLC